MDDSIGSIRRLICTGLALLVMAGCVWLSRGCASAEAVDMLPPGSVEVVADDPADESDVLALARTDHVALLEMCLAVYDARPTVDFTCTFTRREVLGGRTQPQQQGFAKFRQEPFSIAIHWTINPPGGDRVVYVEGLYPDDHGVSQMVVRPTGGIAQFLTGGSVLRVPTADDVLDKTLRPITDFGFRNALLRIADVCRQAEQLDGAGQEFEGLADVSGRSCLVLIRSIAEPWRDDIPNRTRLFIDRELLVPIRLEGYDADDALMWEYQFDDLRLNVGLTDADFTPEANDITPPG